MIITDKKTTYFNSENPVDHFADYCYKIIFEVLEDYQKMVNLEEEIDFIINEFQEYSKNKGEEVYNPFWESGMSLYLDLNRKILRPILNNDTCWINRGIKNFSINENDLCLDLKIEFRTIYDFQDLISFISSNILERRLMKNSEFFLRAYRFFKGNDYKDFNHFALILRDSFFSLDNEIGQFLIQIGLKKIIINSYNGVKLFNTFLSNYQNSIDELYYDLKDSGVDLIEILSKLEIKEIDSTFTTQSYLTDLVINENIEKACTSLSEENLKRLIINNMNRIFINNNHGLWFENYKKLYNKKIKIVIKETPNEMISSYNGEDKIPHLKLLKTFVENETVDCMVIIMDGASKGNHSSNFDHLFSAEPWQFVSIAYTLIDSGFLFDDNSLKLIDVYKLIDSSELLYTESANLSSLTENSDDLIEDALWKAKEVAETELENALLAQEKEFYSEIEKLESIINEKDDDIDNLNEQLSNFV